MSHITFSGEYRNIKTGGRSPGAVELLGSGVCFDSPFTRNLCFVVRVEKKVNIVNIEWWLQLNYMRIMQSKFTNTTPRIFQNSEARARRDVTLWVWLLRPKPVTETSTFHFIRLLSPTIIAHAHRDSLQHTGILFHICNKKLIERGSEWCKVVESMVCNLQTDITNHLQVPRPKPKHGADFFYC